MEEPIAASQEVGGGVGTYTPKFLGAYGVYIYIHR